MEFVHRVIDMSNLLSLSRNHKVIWKLILPCASTSHRICITLYTSQCFSIVEKTTLIVYQSLPTLLVQTVWCIVLQDQHFLDLAEQNLHIVLVCQWIFRFPEMLNNATNPRSARGTRNKIGLHIIEYRPKHVCSTAKRVDTYGFHFPWKVRLRSGDPSSLSMPSSYEWWCWADMAKGSDGWIRPHYDSSKSVVNIFMTDWITYWLSTVSNIFRRYAQEELNKSLDLFGSTLHKASSRYSIAAKIINAPQNRREENPTAVVCSGLPF